MKYKSLFSCWFDMVNGSIKSQESNNNYKYTIAWKIIDFICFYNLQLIF